MFFDKTMIEPEKLNRSINHLKKRLSQDVEKSLIHHFDDDFKSEYRDDAYQVLRTVARVFTNEIFSNEGSVIQMLHATASKIEDYEAHHQDQTSDGINKQKLRSQINRYVDNINDVIEESRVSFESRFIDMIGHQHLDFKSLIQLPQIGWKRISTLYQAILGNSISDVEYIKAYVDNEVLLKSAEQDQKLWLTKEEIENVVESMVYSGLGHTDDDLKTIHQKVDETLEKVLNDENLVHPIYRSTQAPKAYAHAYYYEMFYDLFNRIKARINRTTPLVENSRDLHNLDVIIREIEKENGFDFTLEQREAIYGACQNNVFSLTGLAGTGKSTAVKAIVRIYEKMGVQKDEILGTSFTGQATYNLRQSVGFNASQCATIHKWLTCNQHLDKESRGVPSYDDLKLIVIDEFSMVSLTLINKLLIQINDNDDVRILFVGDVGQLPSIDISFALDFIASEINQQIELQKVVRQKDDSIIPVMANEAREGRVHDSMVDENCREKNFRFLSRTGYDNIIQTSAEAYLRYISKNAQSDIQVLTNTNRLVNMINQKVQSLLLKQTNKLDETCYFVDNISQNKRSYYKGDRILITKNMMINGKSIFNGAKGFITDIEFDSQPLMMQEQTDEFEYTLGDVKSITIDFDSLGLGCMTLLPAESHILSNITLAYASTTHKAQGSTIRDVILAIGRAEKLNSRQLIYTGLTRTSNTLTLVSSPNIIKKAIDRDVYNNARLIYKDIIKQLNQNEYI